MKLTTSFAAIAMIAAMAAPALAQQMPTPEERAAAFTRADADHDAHLTFAEWKTTIPAAMASQATDEQLQGFFSRRDADHDGKLSQAEYTAPMQRPQ